MIFDFRIKHHSHEPVSIKGKNVEIVSTYKYVGVILDNKLKFHEHVNKVYSKCQQRLYFLRKMKEFKVEKSIMSLFYSSVIDSILTFSLIVFFGSVRKYDSLKLNRIRKVSQRITGVLLCNLDATYHSLCKKKLGLILKDVDHPLNCNYTLLRSGIRLKQLKCRTTRYQNTFVPHSICVYNQAVSR